MRILFQLLEQRVLLSAAFDVTGVTALRGDSAYSSVDGSGIGVAILDTGVYAANPDLSSQVVAYYNAVENAVPTSITSSSVSQASDSEGHGTHVSGIAASADPDIGVAYKAQLINVKVLADSGESQLGGDPLLRGLQFVERYSDQFNIKVVNLSIGESSQNGGLNLNNTPAADDIAREIQVLEGLGITVVAASGNSYANSPTPGASYPAVVSTISVASTWADSGAGYNFNTVAWGTSYDNYAAFEQSASADRFSATSQRSTLDNQVAAPGVNIYSDWNNSSSESGSDLLHNTLSGTSMAAPFITGVVALIQDAAFTFSGKYITDPQQVLQIIKSSADQITDSNVSDNGRVPLVNGTPNTSQTLNLPETGDTFSRVNVYQAIQLTKQLVTNGAPSTADTNNTTAIASALPDLNGIRSFTQRGSIGSDGLNQVGQNDVDLYKLVLTSPGSIRIALSQPTSGTAFAGSLRLFDSTGAQIDRADSTGGAYPSLATDENSPLPAGTYYVGISSLNNVAYAIADASGIANGTSTGDYTLSVSLSNPDPNGVGQGAFAVDLTDPTTIFPGTSNTISNKYLGVIGSDPVTGSTDRVAVPDGDVDMFKIVAPDTGTLTIDTESASYGADAVDSYVVLLDENLAQISANDDKSRFNTDSFLQAHVTVGHTYYLAVTNFANRSFDASNPYGRVAGSTPADAFYDLYLAFDNGDRNGNALLATAAGIGSTVSDAVGTDSSAAIGANQGTKDVDFYTMTAGASGLLDLALTSTTSGFSPTMQLWTLTADRSSITQIGQATGSGSHLIEQVSAGQTVYVSVTGQGNNNFNWFAVGSGSGGQTGRYTLGSTLRAASDLKSLNDNSIQNGTPQTITLGTGVYGNLGTDAGLIVGASDVDVYKFVPTESRSYDIRTDTSREGSADTVLRLFDSSGNQLAANDNGSNTSTSSAIRMDLTAGQTYYIGVSGSGSGTSYDANTGAGIGSGSTGDYGVAVTVVAGSTTGQTATITDVVVNAPTSGTATATFMITLASPATGMLTIDYATADGTGVAGTDYTAASGTITFAAGETSKTVSVDVLTNSSSTTDRTFSLNLTASSGDVDLTRTAGVATISVSGASNTLEFGGKVKATYTGADGRPVHVVLKGAGSGQVVLLGDGVATLTLTGTDASSALSIAGNTTLQGLSVSGSLKSIAGKTTDLTGDVSVSGSLAKLMARNASGGHAITVAAGAPLAITLGSVSDFSINSGSPIGNLRAVEWLDSDNSGESIAAPSIASIAVKGNFAADVIVDALGKVSITGALSSSTIRSTGDITSVKAATFSGSQIFAGMRDDLDALPTSVDDFVTAATIGTITVASKGASAFANTVIAAAQIKKVSLGSVATANDGTPVGVAADGIGSFAAVIGTEKVKRSKLIAPDDSLAQGDFNVLIL